MNLAIAASPNEVEKPKPECVESKARLAFADDLARRAGALLLEGYGPTMLSLV